MGKGVEFLHGQRIHVGAKAHRTGAGSTPDHPHHTRHTHTAKNRNLPRFQLLRHHVGGTLLFITKFRMGMNIAAYCLQLGMKFDNRVDQFHGAALR